MLDCRARASYQPASDGYKREQREGSDDADLNKSSASVNTTQKKLDKYEKEKKHTHHGRCGESGGGGGGLQLAHVRDDLPTFRRLLWDQIE
jgi:hypothetical protein